MTLLEILSPSYKHLITTLKMMPMKELNMKYVTTRLTYKISKKKEKEPQDNDVVILLHQDKGTIHFGVKMARRATIMTPQATLHIFVTNQ